MTAKKPSATARATVRLMTQDPALAVADKDLVERKHLQLPDAGTDRFLDGPVTRRLAVVDLDPATGLPVAAPVRFVRGNERAVSGRYDVPGSALDHPSFIAVNAFGTAFKTIEMFEHPGGIGRRVRWAFGREQLLIVPRAGFWANAVYDRRTGSLQFYQFVNGDRTIYTALSRDIVAHECGHALLDAVVPSLLDALTPQSQAIHESVADLIALLMALQSPGIREREIAEADRTELRLTRSGALATIGQQFGQNRPAPDGSEREALRVLNNEATMSTVSRESFHVQSTVLSGIFYDTLQSIFQRLTAQFVTDDGLEPDRAAAKALGSAFYVLRRLLLRGIDYLPPGEVNFVDFGRAVIAADRAGRVRQDDPDQVRAREALNQRFVTRGIVTSTRSLRTSLPTGLDLRPDALTGIRDSDWVAYQFVDAHRRELGIPDDVVVTVLPRVDAEKQVGVKDESGHYALQRELLLKVAWEVEEPNRVAGLSARRRLVRTGVTLAIDWLTAEPLALVPCSTTTPAMARERDAALTRLVDHGLIRAVTPGTTNAGEAASLWVDDGDRIRVRASHRLLHLEEGA